MQRKFYIPNQISEGITIEGDYATVPFRMLSVGLIAYYWIDFPEDVLQKALPKFNNVTIFPDHKPSIRDWIGVTTNARFTNSKGVLGIDADFKIDIVQNPEIIRGLQMQPPAIKHCSVGVNIDYKMSHNFKTEWEFERHLGQTLDGETVRYIVTEILDVLEVSLVYKGADPYATRLTQKEQTQMKLKNKTLVLLGQIIPESEKEKEVEIQPEELHAIVERHIKQNENDLKTLSEIRNLINPNLNNEELLETINLVVEEHDAFLEHINQEIEKARKEAIKYYKLYAQGKENPQIISLIENADYNQAQALATEYKQLLETKYPTNPNTNTKAFYTEADSIQINLKEYEV